jgi:hypothetical protein
MNKISDNDPDRAKGATEGEEHHHDGNLALSEQLGHRDQNTLEKTTSSKANAESDHGLSWMSQADYRQGQVHDENGLREHNNDYRDELPEQGDGLVHSQARTRQGVKCKQVERGPKGDDRKGRYPVMPKPHSIVHGQWPDRVDRRKET